jgi:predicted phage terminase large subunit-like protein
MLFLKLTCLDALYGGAAGGGKSDALLMAALQYVDQPGYHAILIRDTYKNLSMPEALMDRSMQWLYNTDAQWLGENKTWVFPSKSTISFGYLDGPNDHFNYQSSEFQFVGLDEAVNIRENQALYMFSRLRRLKNSTAPIRFRCASNPPAREQVARGEWVKRRYIDKHTKDDGNIFIPSRLNDNPYLDATVYVKSLDKLDPITRAQLLNGDWDIKVDGRMFSRDWFKIAKIAPKEVVKRVRYWDMAATEPSKKNVDPDYTSGCKMSITQDGIFYIESIIRFRKKPRETEATIRQVADLDGKDTAIWIEQEPGSSGKSIIDHYRRHILPEFIFYGDKASGSKSERATPFSSQAHAGNVYLVDGAWCRDFLDEIELFPDGNHDDQVDSCSGAFDKLFITGAEPRISII